MVNDLGGAMDGTGGADAAVASAVASEIVDLGGEAVADANDVATAAGGQALSAAALERFGRVDVVINNAGVIRWAGMPDVDESNLAVHLAVHVGGSFHTTRAAWPHLVAHGYGRVVMTTSAGLFGLADNTSYAAAKGAVVGLMRSLAVAGGKHGIKVNCIAPAAFTRMAGRGSGSPEMAPDHVAPMAAFLAHEDCPVNGEIYAAGFGRFARVFVATTDGWIGETGVVPTIEDVAGAWAAINDESGYRVPADLPSWSAAFTAHLR